MKKKIIFLIQQHNTTYIFITKKYTVERFTISMTAMAQMPIV